MALVWNDGLNVGVPVMDADHRDLFILLAQFEDADDATTTTLFGMLVRHLTEHFDRENRLMHQHGFFASHCHQDEHESVLAEVGALHAKAVAGDVAPVRAYLKTAIVPWFLNHRNTMDWVTAQFLRGCSNADGS